MIWKGSGQTEEKTEHPRITMSGKLWVETCRMWRKLSNH